MVGPHWSPHWSPDPKSLNFTATRAIDWKAGELGGLPRMFGSPGDIHVSFNPSPNSSLDFVTHNFTVRCRFHKVAHHWPILYVCLLDL
jgi:hypothetical protein